MQQLKERARLPLLRLTLANLQAGFRVADPVRGVGALAIVSEVWLCLSDRVWRHVMSWTNHTDVYIYLCVVLLCAAG